MPEIPQRVSLLAQTVDSLRRGIAGNQWDGILPPERTLCDQWNISRSTLRRAINKIEDEGLIAPGRSGKRRRIIARPDPDTLQKDTRRTRTIAWLTRQNLPDIPSVNLRLIAQLQRRLSAANCILNVVRVPDKAMLNPESHMDQWLREFSPDACILHVMPGEVQRWFHQHQPVACIVGSRSPGVDLASIEIDSIAPLQHAVALLRRNGHQRIGLVRPAEHLIGEDQLEEAFLQLFDDPALPTVLPAPSDPDHLAAEFQRLFARQPDHRPSALVCSLPRLALSTLTWLQQQEIAVPARISIIVLRSQPILDHAFPTLAHYAIHEERAVTQLLPRLLDLLQTQACATSHISLTPEFVPGNTLGPAQ